MDLPTYTSIWRIEKRLYKLYDFRLPMPLPIGQVTVFAAVAVPYVVILQMFGLQFNHTLIWLYILPPGLATWLVTRPVLEGKRLPELVRSQLRYVAEPKVMCRMVPVAERDVLVVTGRVWRPRTSRAGALAGGQVTGVLASEWPGSDEQDLSIEAVGVAARNGGAAGTQEPEVAAAATASRRRPLPPGRSRARGRSGAPERAQASGSFGHEAGERASAERAPGLHKAVGAPVAGRDDLAAGGERAGLAEPAGQAEPVSLDEPAQRSDHGPTAGAARRPAWPITGWASATAVVIANGGAPAEHRRVADAGTHPETEAEPAAAEASLRVSSDAVAADAQAPAVRAMAAQVPAAPAGSAVTGEPAHETPIPSPDSRTEAGSHASAAPGRRQVTVVSTGATPYVERALAGPSARRGDARSGRVAVVPGGHRPGKPDLLQRDRSRSQRPIGAPGRVVVLGCTVGAGQTMIALITGDVLASLRSDRVAVLDLNPGQGSLARRAEARPALGQAALLSPSRLAVITPPRPGSNGPFGGARNESHADAELAFAAATERYELVLADPATAAVPRLLGLADQLVLVAPASGAAPGAVAMTFEWLDAHGHSGLAANAIMVLNGVSRRSVAHVEQAERVCAGRCRAIVRVPWDDQLQHRPAHRMDAASQGEQGRQHWAGVLGSGAAGAFTALGGVLVSSLADRVGGADRTGRADRSSQAGPVPAQAGAGAGHEPAELGRGPR